MREEINLLIQLIQLAEADNSLKESEYEFLLKCAHLLEVDRNEFDTLFAEHIVFSPPEFESQRILQFYPLLLLANVDLKVSSRELAFLRSAGFRMGLNSHAVEAVFIEMKKHKTGMISTNRLIEIFKVYHN